MAFAGRVTWAMAACAALLLTSTAALAQVEGNPFVEPISLAGTWHYLAQDLSPAEAAAADLSTWPTVELPGQREGDSFDPVGWYGIDVKLPPRAQWPEPTPQLAVGPPLFLFAYEVYVGAKLVGTHGSMPPSPRWGPLRHRWLPIPQDAPPDDGRLALRVRVWEQPGLLVRGTGLRCTANAMLLGRVETLKAVVELTNERQRDPPVAPWQPHLPAVLFSLAFVFGCFWLLVRRDRAFLWLTLCLVGLAASYAGDVVVGASDDPQRTGAAARVAGAAFLFAVLRFYREVLVLQSKFAKSLTWAVAAFLVANALALLFDWLSFGLVLATMGSLVVVAGYLLLAAFRTARTGEPDARLIAWGSASALLPLAVLLIMQMVIFDTRPHFSTLVVSSALVDVGILLIPVTMIIVVARRYARSLTDLQAAFTASHRFVPERFLSLLGRETITEVKRADVIERRMAVMFADIRGFTTRSEQAGAEATFNLVNRYLEAIEPAILEHDGFINKFLGDGILALFPDASAGLAGARALQKAVAELNQKLESEGEEAIRVGVGLHEGTVMLGTVGGTQRLDTSVIADAVNLASRIESLTKRYGVDILTTAALLEQAGEAGRTREIDRVVVVGRASAVTLHEVHWRDDVGPPEHDAAYRDALVAYQRGDLSEALAAFEKLADEDPPAARLALQAKQLLAAGVPSSWEGVTVLDEK